MWTRLWTCARSHVDVIFHLRTILRNMTLICLLSFTLPKNRSKNVVEYGSRPRSTLKKPNAPKVARWCPSSTY